LPDKLKDIWKGCGGGQGQSEAGLKLHVRHRPQARWLARAALDGQSAGRSTQCAASGRHSCGSAQHH
jgi:hypothetical protein